MATVFWPHLGRPEPCLEDAATLKLSGELAFTTDSFVMSPLEFPGGSIGRLAACGTINDRAMRGARPVALSAAFIIEEGLPRPVLERAVAALAAAAAAADRALTLLRQHPLGADAVIIGRVEAGSGVWLETPYGTAVRLDMPSGENLPRIC